MRLAFIEALIEAAQRDPRVWLLTADLGYSVLDKFATFFPDRYVNVGVAEQNLAGIAAGLALSGKTPVIYSIANFPTFRCLEQLRVDVCYHEANVKVVAVGGGFAYGAQGYTHHGVEDLAIMRALPGMTVVAPGDPAETRQATTAVIEATGPCYLRLGKAAPGASAAEPIDFELGNARMVRDGRALTLITTGGMLGYALSVAEQLAADRLEARVLSMHTIKPLDERAIHRAARETGGIVTVEDHSISGGLGTAVAEVLAEQSVRVGFFRRWGVPDELYHEIGSQDYLRAMCGDLYMLCRSRATRRRVA